MMGVTVRPASTNAPNTPRQRMPLAQARMTAPTRPMGPLSAGVGVLDPVPAAGDNKVYGVALGGSKRAERQAAERARNRPAGGAGPADLPARQGHAVCTG